MLYPWEHMMDPNPPNHDDLRSLGRRMTHHLPGYDACQDCLGTASGTNVDEAYGRYGVAAYTWELGTTFHQSCSTGSTNFEDDIWPQAAAALQFSAKAARRPYQEPKGPQVRDVVFGGDPVTAGTNVTISGVADDTLFSLSGDPAMESSENITAVYYSIDDPPWTVGLLNNLSASDGAFNDEVIDPFDGSIDTTGLSSGTHLVYLVAEDASGQKGVATAVFLEITGGLFADGFESGDTTQWSLNLTLGILALERGSEAQRGARRRPSVCSELFGYPRHPKKSRHEFRPALVFRWHSSPHVSLGENP